MLSKTLATASILLLSLQAITALPTTPPTIGKGVIVVSNHGARREHIVIGSRTAPPLSQREAEANAEAKPVPGGSAWGGR